MISVNLARELRDAGLRWSPTAGDRFVVTDRGMDAEVLMISEMTVEVQDVPTGRLIRFNGTTEWALDSIRDTDAVWLPRETQLRELLAGTFQGLERIDGGFRVRILVNGVRGSVEDPDVEQAYGRALLELVGASSTAAGTSSVLSRP